uniref:SMB domain-containing protein n=1 Tax=Globodera pallida TaxID=36090 RepID=A0A183C8R4_GLOPA
MFGLFQSLIFIYLLADVCVSGADRSKSGGRSKSDGGNKKTSHFNATRALIWVKKNSEKIVDGVKFGVDKATKLACKHHIACKGCNYGSCIETPGAKADSCCQDGYKKECCKKPLSSTTFDPELASRTVDDGHWGSCMEFEGWTGDACCGEGYTFKCCEKPPPVITCQEKSEQCPCGWGNCIRKEGWKADGCCDVGYEFKCCQSSTTVAWTEKQMVDLIEAMDKKDECQSSAEICLCGFDAFARVDKRIAGMCCDGGTCLCCSTVFFTDPALKQIPKVMRDHSESTQCKKRLPCGSDEVSPLECAGHFACHSYCVWNEGFSASDCCSENYTLRCWNQAPRPVVNERAMRHLRRPP